MFYIVYTWSKSKWRNWMKKAAICMWFFQQFLKIFQIILFSLVCLRFPASWPDFDNPVLLGFSRPVWFHQCVMGHNAYSIANSDISLGIREGSREEVEAVYSYLQFHSWRHHVWWDMCTYSHYWHWTQSMCLRSDKGQSCMGSLKVRQRYSV